MHLLIVLFTWNRNRVRAARGADFEKKQDYVGTFCGAAGGFHQMKQNLCAGVKDQNATKYTNHGCSSSDAPQFRSTQQLAVAGQRIPSAAQRCDNECCAVPSDRFSNNWTADVLQYHSTRTAEVFCGARNGRKLQSEPSRKSTKNVGYAGSISSHKV